MLPRANISVLPKFFLYFDKIILENSFWPEKLEVIKLTSLQTSLRTSPAFSQLAIIYQLNLNG